MACYIHQQSTYLLATRGGASGQNHTRRSAPVMLQKLGCDSDMMDTKLRNVREKLGFSDVHGDCARFVPVIKELNGATDATNRKDSPSGIIMRKKVGGSGKNLHLPVKKPVRTGIPEDCKGARKEGKKAWNVSVRDKMEKDNLYLLVVMGFSEIHVSYSTA